MSYPDARPGERWRATFEGVVVERSENPSEGNHFAIRADGHRAPEEFWPDSQGWVYEKIADKPEPEHLVDLPPLSIPKIPIKTPTWERVVVEMAEEHNARQAGLISAGGWCAPSEQMYDLHREWTIEDYQKAWRDESAKRKAWKRRAKIAEAKLLLGRK